MVPGSLGACSMCWVTGMQTHADYMSWSLLLQCWGFLGQMMKAEVYTQLRILTDILDMKQWHNLDTSRVALAYLENMNDSAPDMK